MSFKDKTITGFTWSFIDIIARQSIVFIIGIILARLLSPSEFGLIGMTTIFISLSQTFIDGGFGQALVRKQDCTQADYSTVFFFNLFISLLLTGLLFIFSGSIARFFNEPDLKLILQVLSFGLIILSISVIQSVILIKRIDFRTLAKISIISSLLSGAIGIYMAIKGFGVWSLVVKNLAGITFTSILLWIWNKWSPGFIFSMKSFRELFSFGSKLLASNLINKIYDNIYLLVIGKYFSVRELGYFTRATQFNNLFSKNITMVIQRVSYPSLASIQDEAIRLKESYRLLIRSSMLVVFALGLGILSMAEPMIVFLIGEKWLPSVVYLQLLSISGILYPLQEINKSMLKVKGRSDIILSLDIILKIISVPFIIIGVIYGIKELILGIIFISLISFISIAYYSGKAIQYRLIAQLKDISGSFLVCLLSSIISFLFLSLFDLSPGICLLIQGLTYMLLVVLLSESLKIKEYIFLKSTIKQRIKTLKSKNT